jgi:chloramphenicol-sensitive protein RarD
MSNIKNTNKHFLAALAAFTIWGLFSVVLNPVKSYPATDILFYRVFLSAFFLLLYCVLFQRKLVANSILQFKKLEKKEQKSTLWLTFLGGFLLTANWFVFIYVMNNVSIKAAAYAYLVCPIITTIMAYFLLKEKLSKNQWMAIAISVISILVLAFYNLTDLFYSLIVALTYAYFMISQTQNNKLPKLIILTLQMLFSSLIIAPFYPIYASALPQESVFYIALIIMAIGFTIAPLLLNLFALEGIPSSTIGILLYINPILNFLIAVFFYNEQTQFYQWLSYGLAAISIIVYNSNYFIPKKLQNTK